MIRPHQYGYKTLKTGNTSHKPSTPEQRERAKRYALANGFYGQLGGWVHDKNGQHVAHGYGQFWHRYHTAIVLWEKSNA